MASNHPSRLNLATIPGDHVLESPRLSELRIPADAGVLCLSRHAGEAIVIHDGHGHVAARIKFQRNVGGKMRMVIEADRRLVIDRDEVYRDKQRETGRG